MTDYSPADLDHPDLRSLARVSRAVGRDVTLVQGAGGNSSVKLGDVLWVKASGTWLADAATKPLFVPVDLAVARRAIIENEEKNPADRKGGVWGKSGVVRADLGGRRIIQKTTIKKN